MVSALTNGVLRVASTLNPGGALTVTNLGTDALVAGNSFRILNVNTFGVPNFAATNLPALNAGLAWDASALKTTGTIVVLATEPATPPTLTFVSGGTSLTLSRPPSYTSYVLQVQTNNAAVGLGTNWFTITSGVVSNSFTTPVSASDADVFYRLLKP